MTPTDIEKLTSALKDLAGTATEGPWEVSQEKPFRVVNPKGDAELGSWTVAANIFWRDNADWIAAANPVAVLSLIAALEAAEERRDAAEYAFGHEIRLKCEAIGLHREALAALEAKDAALAEEATRADKNFSQYLDERTARIAAEAALKRLDGKLFAMTARALVNETALTTAFDALDMIVEADVWAEPLEGAEKADIHDEELRHERKSMLLGIAEKARDRLRALLSKQDSGEQP